MEEDRTSGDLLGETKDTRPDLAGLRYSDIQIVVSNEAQMTARVKICSAKGMKTDGSATHDIKLAELINEKDSMLCLIKVILILAMRSGNKEFRSFNELITQMSAPRGNLMTWRYPDRPVICAWYDGGIGFQKLAAKQRCNRTMIKALHFMGAGQRGVHASPHQIRYGMASALLKTKPKTGARQRPNFGSLGAYTGFKASRRHRDLHRATYCTMKIGVQV